MCTLLVCWDVNSAASVLHLALGSTALPKPIFWNDRHLLQISLAPCMSASHFYISLLELTPLVHGAHDFCGQVFGGHVVQISECLGLSFIAWVVCALFPSIAWFNHDLSHLSLAYNWSNSGDLPSCKPCRQSVKSINLERFFGHKSVLYILLASVI